MKKFLISLVILLMTIMASILPNFNNEKISAETVSITISNPQSHYMLSDELEINFEVDLPEDADNIAWLILKPNETNFISPIATSVSKETLPNNKIRSKLNFQPVSYGANAGIYAFAVKYSTTDKKENFTDFSYVNIELKEIATLNGVTIQNIAVKNSKSNLQAYKFFLVGLDDNANTYQIEWWVGSTLRAYGKEFVFEPDYPGEFNVTAKIGNLGTLNETVTSIVVNTKLQIIIISSILGVLILSLIIGIIINRKSERIW